MSQFLECSDCGKSTLIPDCDVYNEMSCPKCGAESSLEYFVDREVERLKKGE